MARALVECELGLGWGLGLGAELGFGSTAASYRACRDEDLTTYYLLLTNTTYYLLLTNTID